MGHHIQAIVAPDRTADAVAARWPELPRLRHEALFSIFPVDAGLIDATVEPIAAARPPSHFILLTPGFRERLRKLSSDGVLAYLETDYFGGAGGQGALVADRGVERMEPTWSEADAINRALKLIGFPRGGCVDRFENLGLASVRDNEDLLDLIQTPTNDAPA
ncbi:hypothetical protein [Alienimonas sp. DA493]|uniref:hypothetical protein n=1 Tax=Alienimonas sp. DA493 TaxID=3373605 RepID=UPI0037549D98